MKDLTFILWLTAGLLIPCAIVVACIFLYMQPNTKMETLPNTTPRHQPTLTANEPSHVKSEQ